MFDFFHFLFVLKCQPCLIDYYVIIVETMSTYSTSYPMSAILMPAPPPIVTASYSIVN